MGRCARYVGLLVVLGVGLNVAIAWCLALWAPVGASPPTRFSINAPHDVAVEIDAARSRAGAKGAWESVFGSRDEGAGVTLIGCVEVTYKAVNAQNPIRLLYVLRAGWPWRCVSAKLERDVLATDQSRDRVFGGIETPEWLSAREFTSESQASQDVGLGEADRRLLPLRVEWGGMLKGSAFYTGAIGVLFVPFVIRRVRRKRLGHCAACGYELAGLSLCPECGTEVPAPAEVA